jgi:DNA-binding MurR/RpiR family transcriptional regulator
MPIHNAELRVAGAGVSTLTDIQSRLDAYPPSIRRVADAILSRPQVVLELTITELAHACSTSETTVVRFCRTLGFSGLRPFKLSVAAELATESARHAGPALEGTDILATDDLAAVVAKVSAVEMLALRETASGLDLAALKAVIERIVSASTIVLHGVGASALGADDLTHKLQHIGRPAFCDHDSHSAIALAALLHEDGVAIGFSHGGRTRETVEFLRVARRTGATAVAITNARRAPITTNAAFVLHTAVRETELRPGAMASRIAQLTLVDYIFVGVAQARYAESVEALRLSRASVSALRAES